MSLTSEVATRLRHGQAQGHQSLKQEVSEDV